MNKLDKIIKLHVPNKYYYRLAVCTTFTLETLVNFLVLNNEKEFKEIKDELLRIYLDLPTDNIDNFISFFQKEGFANLESLKLTEENFHCIIDNLFFWRNTKKGHDFWLTYDDIFRCRKFKIILDKNKIQKIQDILK